MAVNANKRLYRSKDAIIGGVCAGIADYFDVDVTLVRIITVVLVLAGAGFPIIIYIICLIAVPKQTDDYSAYIDVQPVAPPPPQYGAPFNSSEAPVGATGPRYAAATANAGTSTSASGSGTAWTSASGNVGPGVNFAQGAYPEPGRNAGLDPASAPEVPPTPGVTPAPGVAGASGAPHTHGIPPTPEVPPVQSAASACGSGPISSGSAPGSCYTATNPVAYDVAVNHDTDKGTEKKTPGGTVSAAIIIGTILVAIGILALVGKVIGIAIWRFWPLVLILAGLVQMFTPGKEGWSLKRAGDGIVTISLGVVLQAWMLGFVAFSAFVQGFLHFWPVLLVVIGLAVIGTALKKNIVMLMSSLVFSAALIFGVWYYGDFSKPLVFQLDDGRELTLNVPISPRQQLEMSPSNQMTLDLTGIETANLQYKGGVAEAQISAGSSASVELETFESRGNSIQYPQTTANLYLVDGATPQVIVESGNVISGGSQSILLPRDVSWGQIDIDAGASNLSLDLQDLRIGRVSVNSGVSNIELRLDQPTAADSEVDIKAGITSTMIEVPANSAVVIYSKGLNSVTVDEAFFTWNDSLKAWCSNAYLDDTRSRRGTAVPVWTIKQEGMSSLDVRIY